MFQFQNNLTDIKILNGEIYIKHTPQFNLNDFNAFLERTPYMGEKLIKDMTVENTLLPPMIKTFYTLFTKGFIVSPEKFFSYYVKENFIERPDGCITLKFNNSVVLNKEGVRARVYRTYPSLVRDFHFYMLCHCSKKFQGVHYSLNDDYKKGVDLTIKYRDTIFSIALLVDTKRSTSFKKQKYQRHNYAGLHEICVKINPFDKSCRIGDYSLYTMHHIISMIKEMDSIIENLHKKYN